MMDVSVQLLAQAAMDQGGQRAIGAGITAGPAGAGQTSHVQSFSQAFPSAANRAEGADMTGLIDRMRNDFEAFRSRLNPAGEASSIDPSSSQGSVQQMETVMRDSLQTQVDIFEMSISFNAGLTATQQSQSGVKTLVEKT